MKKVLSIAGRVLVWAIAVFSILIMVFTVVSVNTVNKQSGGGLLGFKPFVVLSNSMSDVFVAGDIIVSKSVDTSTLVEGDIITFRSVSQNNYGEVVTHKIRAITTSGSGTREFITYGTATGEDDDAPIPESMIIGKYAFHVPKLGYFFQYLKSTAGYVLFILIPFATLILVQGINCIRLFKRYKGEQLAELESEKSRIEEERLKAADMLEEVRKLKEQLAAATKTQAASNSAMENENSANSESETVEEFEATEEYIEE